MKTDLKKVYTIKDDVLFKSARASIHFLKIPPAIAIDLYIFNEARTKVRYVQVFEKENGIFYTATIKDFINYGFVINRGFGEQIALPMKYWEKSHIPDIVPEIFENREQEKIDISKNSKQLYLFEI